METENSEECSICLQSYIQPAKLPCGHVFCFLCIKGISDKSPRCALCRQEISPEFLENPNLLETAQQKTETDDPRFVWYYEGKNGWWQYDERTSSELEDAYMKNQPQCTILIAGNVYVIDFSILHQCRMNDTSKHRRVKRDLSTRPKKGVGGIRQKHGPTNN
ncbi:E3 ubiquitin-protein ligase rnf146 [Culicoides brevitarsis]|uniref:E3 ubiquitin-protein ligase rnf146 n=1 Tax=Culicoides brevitarsis TaxID=469753 RepID=UPI00307C90B5